MCVCVYCCFSVSLCLSKTLGTWQTIWNSSNFSYINKFHLLKCVCMLLLEGIITTTCSATFPFSVTSTSAHTFLYRPAFSICCTSLPSSCLCLLNTQDNVPQANMANFISHWGLASNYLKMNMDKCILSI